MGHDRVRPAAGHGLGRRQHGAGLTLPARRAVDEVYADLAGAGYPGRQQPYDAFWGARYAIVEDPDGNPVRLISPVDAGLRPWPPAPPPPGT